MYTMYAIPLQPPRTFVRFQDMLAIFTLLSMGFIAHSQPKPTTLKAAASAIKTGMSINKTGLGSNGMD